MSNPEIFRSVCSFAALTCAIPGILGILRWWKDWGHIQEARRINAFKPEANIVAEHYRLAKISQTLGKLREGITPTNELCVTFDNAQNVADELLYFLRARGMSNDQISQSLSQYSDQNRLFTNPAKLPNILKQIPKFKSKEFISLIENPVPDQPLNDLERTLLHLMRRKEKMRRELVKKHLHQPHVVKMVDYRHCWLEMDYLIFVP